MPAIRVKGGTAKISQVSLKHYTSLLLLIAAHRTARGTHPKAKCYNMAPFSVYFDLPNFCRIRGILEMTRGKIARSNEDLLHISFISSIPLRFIPAEDYPHGFRQHCNFSPDQIRLKKRIR